MYLLTCVRAGHFELGDMEVDIRENGDYEGLHAVLSGTKTLAGSVTTLISCVRKYMEFTGCSLAEAIEAASLHPAQALGIDDERGSLEFGRFADIVLLDVDLNVQATSVHECLCLPSVRGLIAMPARGVQVCGRPPRVEQTG